MEPENHNTWLYPDGEGLVYHKVSNASKEQEVVQW